MNKTELQVLAQIAAGNIKVKSIAAALHKNIAQIYRTLQKLSLFVEIKRGIVEPKKLSPLNLLFQLLSTYPNLAIPFSDSGMSILNSLPNNLAGIEQATKLKRSIIYRKLKEAAHVNLITKKDKQYFLNVKLWPQLAELLQEFQRFYELVDERVPTNSVIYHKDKEEIIFSLKAEFEATLTAFSAYEQHGIKLLLLQNYYYLPKKGLNLKEIFVHSLYVTEKDKSIRNLTYVALMCLKYPQLQKIKHFIVKEIRKVLQGKSLAGYPTLQEIKEKAKVYDLQLRFH